jgi:hypothetical protein
METNVRRFAAVAGVISIAAAGAMVAQACSSTSAVQLPPVPDGSTEEASADAPSSSDAAESGSETSTADGPTGEAAAPDAGDAGKPDAPSGDAASDAPPDAMTGD